MQSVGGLLNLRGRQKGSCAHTHAQVLYLVAWWYQGLRLGMETVETSQETWMKGQVRLHPCQSRLSLDLLTAPFGLQSGSAQSPKVRNWSVSKVLEAATALGDIFS